MQGEEQAGFPCYARCARLHGNRPPFRRPRLGRSLRWRRAFVPHLGFLAPPGAHRAALEERKSISAGDPIPCTPGAPVRRHLPRPPLRSIYARMEATSSGKRMCSAGTLAGEAARRPGAHPLHSAATPRPQPGLLPRGHVRDRSFGRAAFR